MEHVHNISFSLCELFFYAPNFEKVGSKLLSACASVRSSFCSNKF